jgi:hypothetical protein
MLEFLWLLLTAVLAWARPRNDLVLENLLLRHQLALLTRPTRTRPRARPRTCDKLLWGPGSPLLRRVARAPEVCHAGHGGAPASAGLAPVLALEVPLPEAAGLISALTYAI